ncbi:DUF3015 domain-containing protein [Vibrio sp. Of7-15]|uniref:DUF3015 family protein n=1 Tax=Vibrio sp. Of7-15 TaxID=2724879 RepID=UPI001EF227E8|nr:DUF3015 family protein [Vibrio sp. Of7-15]MCG7497798.1 DUF3015 domain-containing protein [Vibrio sp. Of7-15]
MFKHIASFALVTSLLSPVAMASEEHSINPWTQCGIGAMVFNDNPQAAAISNVIWDLGTTAVSSNISSESNCEGSEVKTAMFIQQSYNNIIEETAQGNGDHLTAMLDLLEVDAAAREDVLSGVRANMAQTVSQPEYATSTTPEKAEMYYNALIINAAQHNPA